MRRRYIMRRFTPVFTLGLVVIIMILVIVIAYNSTPNSSTWNPIAPPGRADLTVWNPIAPPGIPELAVWNPIAPPGIPEVERS